MGCEVQAVASIDSVPQEAWNALVDADYPFLRHEFLSALEATGAVGPGTGWTPHHLLLRDEGELVGILPRYFKTHSYGEYVFDWAWADAWERAGGRYYPKQVTAIPFTPSVGPRLLLAPSVDPDVARRTLVEAIRGEAMQSWHLLFAGDAEVTAWRSACPELLERQAVQFQWQDDGYGDFEGFLGAMSSRRRKEIRRERRKVAEQGLTLHRLAGEAIDDAALRHFFRCYQMTYLERGQRGYLGLEFFRRLRETMPEALLLVQAREAGEPVAAALCLKGERTLYGRYWGSEVEADCLHFEVCYYQGVEYCLAHGLTRFDPGTQGEHKLTRGFAPQRTRSLHYLAHPDFRDAVARFCAEERDYVAAYHRECLTRLPFRRE
ncbi:GNAT family N-acetyltransferase [Halomonas shantousis]